MVGKVYISGLIGSYNDEKGVELLDVISQVKKQSKATSFDVYVSQTEGGVVETGDDIYEYLVSLDKEKPVTTIAKGLCASISTKIFMAGRNRVIQEGCEFMIHLPMLSSDYLNSNELEEAAKELKDLDDKMVKFYSEATNNPKEAIYPLLRNETWLTADQAVNLGFATEKRDPIKAVAYYKSNTKKMSKQDLSEESKNWITSQFEAFSNLFKPKEAVNIILQDSTGMEIEFPDVEEGQTPSIGDRAIVEGQPAEGSYIMPSLDGVTAVFVGGELTEIVEPDQGMTEEEVAEMKAENERLKSELEQAQAKATEKEASLKDIEDKFLNLKRSIEGKFELTSRKKEGKKQEDNQLNSAKIALNKLRESRKK